MIVRLEFNMKQSTAQDAKLEKVFCGAKSPWYGQPNLLLVMEEEETPIKHRTLDYYSYYSATKAKSHKGKGGRLYPG